jgi:hypothetical protein
MPMPDRNSNALSASYSGLSHKSLLFNTLSTALYKKLNSHLSLSDIHTPLLKEIFKRNASGVKKEVLQIKENLPQHFYHYEMTVAFWMAMHLEYEEICNILLNNEPILKKLVVAIQKK